jgi:hypothetical protein
MKSESGLSTKLKLPRHKHRDHLIGLTYEP